MSGQLIFPTKLDVIKIASISLTSANGGLFAPLATRIATDIAIAPKVIIPDDVTDILFSMSIVYTNPGAASDVSDLFCALVWDGVKDLTNQGGARTQYSGDSVIEAGVFGNIPAAGTLTKRFTYLVGQNATTIKPMIQRGSAATIFANTIINSFAMGGTTPVAFNTVLPQVLTPYFQWAATVAILPAGNITITGNIFGIIF